MADNEDDTNSASSSAAASMVANPATGESHAETTQTAVEGQVNEEAASTAPSLEEGGVYQGLADLAEREPGVDVRVVDGEQMIRQIVGGEVITDPGLISSFIQTAAEAGVTTVSGDVLNALSPNTTIIYVQPDGSFVESSGLSAEEQQQLIEQLAKQQLVHVAESEAPVKPHATPLVDVVVNAQPKPPVAPVASPMILPRPAAATQTTSYIAVEPGSVQLATAIKPQNASQQLQSVAKHVALQQSQNGAAAAAVQKAAEPIKIQVQASAKPDHKPALQTTPITILQPQNLSAGQPLVKVSTVGTLSSPQIIHITPVPGQQQYFLQNPNDPPIQLLLQKPTPVVSTISVPVSHKVQVSAPAVVKSPLSKPALLTSTNVVTSSPKIVAGPVNVPATKVITVGVKTSAPVAKESQKAKNRQKKPLKIQTRSGRVSRPPKHKVKDYKFIKNEDLAESHQSDSDDYSEISVDEDGEEVGKKGSDVSLGTRDKAFKCDTCEKSYIGVAGLSRHYRLYPLHDKHPGTSRAENLCKPAEDPASEGPVTDTSHANAITTPKVQDLVKDEVRRPGRPCGPVRPGLPRRPGRPPKRGRPGRPPKFPRGLSVEEHAQRQRSRLKEFIKQYDDEDLMEIVLPRLARVMTLWEFVLMKVEKGYPSKQQFPSVYREFEQLHGQVKTMALEYLHTSPASRPAIEVNNMSVLQSLGITDPNALKLYSSSDAQKTNPSEPQAHQATKSLRNIENAKWLPPAKRFKMENCNQETNGFQVNLNGIEKEEGADSSAVLRKPQLVLTRLDSVTPVEPPAEDTPSTENPTELRLADEPAPTHPEAAKPAEDPELSKVLDTSLAVDISDQVKQLEQALSIDPDLMDSEEPDPQEGPDCQSSSLEEPMAIEMVQHESPVIIQTAEGLVMQSAEELAAKGIVIVNGPDGTMMHIEAPEGVPLETVHALLGIEMEKKT